MRFVPVVPRRGVLAGTGLLLLLLWAGVAPAQAEAPRPEVRPSVLTFDLLAPGGTASAMTTLTVPGDQDAVVVRAVAAASGDLDGFLTTTVESCTVPWEAGTCPAGATPLLEAPVGEGSETVRVPVPGSADLYLRVGIAVADDAPRGAEGAVRYRLDLAGPISGEGDGGTAGPTLPGLLPRTGADLAATAAAALALVGLGAVLGHRARRSAGVRRGAGVPR